MFMMVVFIVAKRQKREREKVKEKKGEGETDLSKCPILENWLVLMTCHPKKNNVMES